MSLPHYPYYPSDFAADTQHLTNEEVGAYQRLLNFQWLKGPISQERASRVAGSIAQALLTEFFKKDETTGLWENQRMAREKAKAAEKHKKMVEAGRKGGKASQATSQAQAALPAKLKPSSSQATSKRGSNQNQNHIEEEKSKSKKKGTRFTIAQIPDEWISICNKINPLLNPMEVFEIFKDYWTAVPGQKGFKLDWLATWRNWCRRQDPNRVQGNGNSSNSMRDDINEWEDDRRTAAENRNPVA